MDPFHALASFVLGLIKHGAVQAWLRLVASLVATAFVTFFGTLGLTLTAQVTAGMPASTAFILALGYSSLMMALMILGLWLKSPLTKNIPILWPAAIEAARVKELTDQGTVYSANDKR